MSEFLVGLSKLLVALIPVFGLFLAYGSYAESSASRKAEEFCKSLKDGMDTANLLEQAESSGASMSYTQWFNSDGQDQLPVTFSGAMPLSRHICWIKATGGRVVSSHVSYLD